jgi:acetyltransferase
MVDIPEIVEIDINPLFAGDEGVVCVDAHMRVDAAARRPGRLAIRPYPKNLEEKARLRSGREILLRPIRPEDEPAHQTLLTHVTPEDLRFRFFDSVRQMGHSQMARLTQIDYDREMAFIATAPGENGETETLGVVRTVTDPDNVAAEFAILVRSDLKGQGLGRQLLSKIIDYCRRQGTREIVGEILAENDDMLRLASRLGFALEPDRETGTIRARLPLD